MKKLQKIIVWNETIDCVKLNEIEISRASSIFGAFFKLIMLWDHGVVVRPKPPQLDYKIVIRNHNQMLFAMF